MDPLAPSGSGRATFRSRVGFGASGLGTLYRDVPDAQARATLKAAWDAGLRHYDTAPLYGHGLSELRLGQALRDRPRASFTLSTKVGRYLVPPYGEAVDTGLWARPLPLRPVFDYGYDGTMRSLEQSASRLGIDRFDMAYIHDVDRFTHGADFDRRFGEAVEGAFRALDDLRRAGHLGAVGVGVNESDVATRFVEACDLDAVMIAGRHTLLDRRAATDLLPAAAARGVAVVAAGIFNSGLLAAGPEAKGATYDYGAPPPAVLAQARAVATLCEAHGVPLQAAALQFPLRDPRVAAMVIGMSRPERVAQNLAWCDWPIPAAFWDELEGALGAPPSAGAIQPQAERATR